MKKIPLNRPKTNKNMGYTILRFYDTFRLIFEPNNAQTPDIQPGVVLQLSISCTFYLNCCVHDSYLL